MDVNGVSSSNNDAAESSTTGAQQNGKRVIKLRTRSSQRGSDPTTENQDNGIIDGDKESQVQQQESTADGLTEEEKIQEEMKLYQRWAEEYYEIVDQLPLELHRTFALMRELEIKMQDKVEFMASHTIAYRDARLASRSNGGSTDGVNAEEARINGVEDGVEHVLQPDYGSSSDRDAEGEDVDEVYHDVEGNGAVQATPSEADRPTIDEILTPPPPAATNAAATPRAARESLLSAIARASSDAIRAAEEKVGLAVTAYDWVDRHIRRLDADLQRSESSLLLGLRAGTEASRVVREALGSGEAETVFSRGLITREDETTLSRQTSPISNVRSRKSDGRKKQSGADAKDQTNDGDLSTTLLTDMAIDPNEPKYCYCDEVSSGDMVACDNEDCPREWFHYHCVGLTSPPKGKWYCLFCAPPGFKGSGTFPPGAPCLPPGYGSKRSLNADSRGNQDKVNHKKKKKK